MRSLRKVINDLEPDIEPLEPASAFPRRRQSPARRTHVDGVGDAGTQLLRYRQVTRLFTPLTGRWTGRTSSTSRVTGRRSR